MGYASTAIIIIAAIVAIVLWVQGIAPVLIRLGNGLAKRKIAIFAQGDALTTVESLLLESRLFRKRNILRIASDGDFGIAEQATLYLVYWPHWKDSVEEILQQKADQERQAG